MSVTSITLDKTSLKMKEGDSLYLNATVIPSNATDKTIAWSSSDMNIVTVDQTGKVTAIKEGTAIIKAQVSNLVDQCVVNVVKPEIKYLSDMILEYNSALNMQELYFSLKLEDGETRVSSSGTIKMKIVNDSNEEVYNKSVRFSESNFADCSSGVMGTRYLCCVSFSNEDVLPGRINTGKLRFDIELDNGLCFPTSTLSMYHLPRKPLTEYVKIDMPEVPLYTVKTNSNGYIQAGFTITNASYTVSEVTSGKYNVVLHFDGTKDYDISGTEYKRICSFNWELYNGDSLVDNGTVYTSSMKNGEVCRDKTVYLFNMTEGNYTLKILND